MQTHLHRGSGHSSSAVGPRLCSEVFIGITEGAKIHLRSIEVMHNELHMHTREKMIDYKYTWLSKRQFTTTLGFCCLSILLTLKNSSFYKQ